MNPSLRSFCHNREEEVEAHNGQGVHEEPVTKCPWVMMRGWLPIFRGVEVGRLVEISTLLKKTPNMIVTMQSLHDGSVGYQHTRTRVGLTKKAKFLQMQLRTRARRRKTTTKLQMNDYTQKLGSYKP
jgi:hypothetical protein